MHRWTILFVGTWGLFGGVPGADAGVYSIVEPAWPLSNDFGVFRDHSLIPLRTWVLDNQWIEKLYDQSSMASKAGKDGLSKSAPEPLTTDERMNLAANLMRCKQPDKAIQVLTTAQARERDNFMISSMLGTAHFMAGRFQRALDMLDDGLSGWRQPFAELKQKKHLEDVWKWNEEKFAWYGRCEQVLRRLARARLRESPSGPLNFEKTMNSLDGIFPEDAKPGVSPVQFVGKSGQFEPGKMAASELAKLPKDAIRVVEQLLIWLPDDMRIYRLLGELLNAHGDTESAKEIFGEMYNKFAQNMYGPPPVTTDPAKPPTVIYPDRATIMLKFMAVYPEVAGKLKALNEFVPRDLLDSTPAVAAPAPAAKPVEPSSASIKIDWQTLAVGLGAGALVGFLACWRVRGLLMRRSGRA
jgi:tetratricopeptide (TPR) repeat protein